MGEATQGRACGLCPVVANIHILNRKFGAFPPEHFVRIGREFGSWVDRRAGAADLIDSNYCCRGNKLQHCPTCCYPQRFRETWLTQTQSFCRTSKSCLMFSTAPRSSRSAASADFALASARAASSAALCLEIVSAANCSFRPAATSSSFLSRLQPACSACEENAREEMNEVYTATGTIVWLKMLVSDGFRSWRET